MIENVRGLVSKKGAFVKDIIERFGGIGYNVSYKILNASLLWSPTKNFLVFFVGLLEGEFEFPEKFFYKFLLKKQSWILFNLMKKLLKIQLIQK